MCPSYQATREESNSTRGRANLLRAFISQPASAGMNNPEFENAVARALDLCLACKGCKAECPSGVDMAKLKYEFENRYYKTHRRPLRDYVFGYFHVTAKLGSLAAPLSNAMMQIPLVKNILAGVLGITDKRPFPRFAGRRAKVAVTNAQGHGGKIIFLSDPYARYIEPQVEQAAFDVLSACGYAVHVLPVVGAGAAFLAKSLIDPAKRHAGKVLDALDQLDPKNEAVIVGLEPPDIYALKHDYFSLLPERADEIASRAARTWLLDEYLVRSSKFQSLRVGSMAKDRVTIKFQPHCHQRAEGLAEDGLLNGANATVDLLQSCGYEVELLDTGCCGMAGTFGYEADHYELSMQVGELKLFPAIREQKKIGRDYVVASTGAACRMQVQQGTGVDAVHPIMLVRERLVE
jgi:Fe-S oxidoreductase